MRWLLLLSVLLQASLAHASGPVERLMQLLVNPSQPELLVVRYGAGANSHGYLISRDGGRSFRLLCSANVAANTADALSAQRISTRPIPATAASALDERGVLMFAQYGVTWVDDGTGCSWADEPPLRGKWPLGLKLDPRDPARLWSVVSTTTQVKGVQKGTFELMRRDGQQWKTVGPVRPVDADKVVLDASLVVHADATLRRLYVSVLLMGARGASAAYVMLSDDGGATWFEHALPKEQERLSLLAIDPTNPDRLLAAVPRDGAADTLLLSVDAGASFQTYLEPRAVGGASFDETGRVYLGDTGDGASPEQEGGLYTAARLGEPLSKIAGTSAVDCVLYQPRSGLLYVCQGDRFGVVDPASGVLDELLRLDRVSDFIACPGKDLHAVCQHQLNSGPSWCCAGHYPFTPLCGDYDVTERPDKGRVFCGLSGRKYDGQTALRTVAPPVAAKVEAKRGCQLAERGGGAVLLLALLRARRRSAST